MSSTNFSADKDRSVSNFMKGPAPETIPIHDGDDAMQIQLSWIAGPIVGGFGWYPMLQIALGSTPAAVASILVAWIRHHKASIKIKLKRDDETLIELDLKNTSDPVAIIERFEELINNRNQPPSLIIPWDLYADPRELYENLAKAIEAQGEVNDTQSGNLIDTETFVRALITALTAEINSSSESEDSKE
ncbi:hypothetical protein ACFYTC_49060 [Actinomadura nitritigenes]|uniref:effector-associated constant component EACC1 n=1 Tax=Actinomadura nitritigenes TaxID=134602 RepID=UPI00368E96ED